MNTIAIHSDMAFLFGPTFLKLSVCGCSLYPYSSIGVLSFLNTPSLDTWMGAIVNLIEGGAALYVLFDGAGYKIQAATVRRNKHVGISCASSSITVVKPEKNIYVLYVVLLYSHTTVIHEIYTSG